MTARLIRHARSHVVAYLALCAAMLALAGASYAAFQIPAGSVGERQLRNGTIDPVKLDPAYISAAVRRWANVAAGGQLASSSSSGASTSTGTGNYVVTWGDAFSSRCVALATVQAGPSAATPTTTPTTSTTTTTPSTTTTAPSTTTTTTTSSTTAAPSTTGGYADASIVLHPGGATFVDVETFNAAGQPAAEPFGIAIVCPPGAGSGQTFPFTLP